MISFPAAATAVTLFVAQAQEGPAPEDVKAGWLGFAVWMALAAGVVFLGFSLRKHLKRVTFDEGSDEDNGSKSEGRNGSPTQS